MKQVTINEERLRSIIRETLTGIMETMKRWKMQLKKEQSQNLKRNYIN